MGATSVCDRKRVVGVPDEANPAFAGALCDWADRWLGALRGDRGGRARLEEEREEGEYAAGNWCRAERTGGGDWRLISPESKLALIVGVLAA